jgi:hypothetical protein
MQIPDPCCRVPLVVEEGGEQMRVSEPANRAGGEGRTCHSYQFPAT